MGGLQDDWLAIKMETSETAAAFWSPGIQASFESLFDEPSNLNVEAPEEIVEPQNP